MTVITEAFLKQQFDPARVDQLVDDGYGPDSDIITAIIASADGQVKTILSKQYTEAQIEADEARCSFDQYFARAGG